MPPPVATVFGLAVSRRVQAHHGGVTALVWHAQDQVPNGFVAGAMLVHGTLGSHPCLPVTHELKSIPTSQCRGSLGRFCMPPAASAAAVTSPVMATTPAAARTQFGLKRFMSIHTSLLGLVEAECKQCDRLAGT